MRKIPFFFSKSSEGAENVQNGAIYKFSDFCLVTDDHLLLRNGEPVPLPPKAYETLALLIERHGHLVKKAELIEKVWSDAFVEEAVVSKSVWMIRNALGEDSKSQQFIQTVPKRGYKFVADVIELKHPEAIQPETKSNGAGASVVAERSLPADGSDQVAERTTAEISVPGRTRGVYFALAAIALALVASIAMYVGWAGTSTAKGGSHIAVLPLKPIDAANRSDIFEIGVADSLINRLNSINGLIVRPLSATRKYDALDQDPLAAGREQKVDHIIASNYQVVDGRFRLTAQLINVASGQVVESYKVETDGGNVFAIQDSVAAEIGNRIVARFGKTLGPSQKRGTSNEQAYRLYLQGKNLTMIRNPAFAKKAVEYLEQAIGLDPNFAAAYAQLARAHRATNTRDIAGYEKSIDLINRALELDPDLAEAYVARAEVSLLRDWNFQAVEKDLKKAIELEPNNDLAIWWSAQLAANRGQFDEALSKTDIAQAIDPGAVVYIFHRGRILYYAHRYDEAVAQYQQAIELDERFMQPYLWMSRLYETKGDYATAYEYFLKSEERSPRKDSLEAYRKAYEAGGWIAVRQHQSETFDFHFFDMARLYALSGQTDAAFECLNKAIAKRDWHMITLNVEPAFDNLRQDPRFAEVVRKVFGP